MRVFFYGLFMDEDLLKAKGIQSAETRVGFVNGHRLRIGERATLVRHPDGRAYGVVMEIAIGDAKALYAEDGVADYLPEPVTVELMDGTRVAATCYNLPGDRVTGANKEYADSLLGVAIRLGFPDAYLDQIRRLRTNTKNREEK